LSEINTYIFVHIPKTGGITFCNLIDRLYHPSEVFSINGNNVPESREVMERLPEEERARFRWVKGHLSFGWDQYLPGPSQYFAIFRDPVKRIISEYYYILRTPVHPCHKKLVEEKISLREYGTGFLIWTCENAHVRSLCNFFNTGRRCAREHFERASENLQKKFLFAGLQERFDETLLLLQRKLNWERPPYYIISNVASNKPRNKDFPQETLEAIKAHNALDVELYEHARKTFSKLLKEENVTETDLELFCIQNREFQDNYTRRTQEAAVLS